MLARRLFLSGLGAMGVFAIAHFGGFLAAARAARTDPGMADLTRAMRAHTTEVLGFRPSILDFREYFSLNFSILMLLAAVLGYVALSVEGPQHSAAIRPLAIVYALAMLVLLGSSALFSVVQGVISCLVIALLFGLAAWFA
jgi:hypothetical protein